MRLISVVVIVLIVGGIAYLLVFKRDWVSKKVEEGKDLAYGYKAAQTPAEAMDLFRKAIKDRKYKTASKYCAGDYAEQLAKADAAGQAVGNEIDRIIAFMNNKGLKTDRSMTLLYALDPFPGNFKVKDAPQKKDDDKAIGQFELEPISGVVPEQLPQYAQTLDFNMLKHNLAPIDIRAVEIVREGKGDAKSWKLNFPLVPGQAQMIAHFIDQHKTYVTGLSRFRGELTNERFGSKKEFEDEVVKVLQGANVK